ncbi:MAG: ExbD/TolR family protein [Candidatus Anammoxibacter sp.]
MQFRLKRISKPIINIAPLVDVLFLLLIFFMVTSTFVEQPSIQLDLPSTKYAETSEIKELQLVLVITRYGKIYLQGEIVNINELENILRDLTVKMEEKTLVLKADKDVTYGTVIKVMDAAKGAGMRKIIAPTLLEDKIISP